MRVLTTILSAITMVVASSVSVGSLCASDSMLVFVTSKRYDGNLGGIEGADQICQNHAVAAELPGTYRAWISSSSEQSPLNTFSKSTGPYVLSNKTLIANNWDDLSSGELLAAMDHDEYGANVGYQTRVWTGTTPQGEDLGKDNCNGWRSDSINDSGWVGIVSSFWTSEWSVEMSVACDEGVNLYCIQQ